MAKKVSELSPLQKILGTKFTLGELLEASTRASDFDGILSAACNKMKLPSEVKKEVCNAFTEAIPFSLKPSEEPKAEEPKPNF